MDIYAEWHRRFRLWLCRHGVHDWVNVEVTGRGGDWRQYAICSRCSERTEGQVL